VLKLSGQDNELIQKDIQNIKTRLRTKKYFNKEIVITDRLTDEQLSSLHNSCDCFVVTSYGEAFCRPSAEALCHGNYLISSSNIGVLDHVEKDDVDIVECYPSPVLLDNPESMGGLDIYNANEIWYVPNILDLRKK
jgi:glycosyltransferase involved in cell wall biosynthesis